MKPYVGWKTWQPIRAEKKSRLRRCRSQPTEQRCGRDRRRACCRRGSGAALTVARQRRACACRPGRRAAENAAQEQEVEELGGIGVVRIQPTGAMSKGSPFLASRWNMAPKGKVFTCASMPIAARFALMICASSVTRGDVAGVEDGVAPLPAGQPPRLGEIRREADRCGRRRSPGIPGGRYWSVGCSGPPDVEVAEAGQRAAVDGVVDRAAQARRRGRCVDAC